MCRLYMYMGFCHGRGLRGALRDGPPSLRWGMTHVSVPKYLGNTLCTLTLRGFVNVFQAKYVQTTKKSSEFLGGKWKFKRNDFSSPKPKAGSPPMASAGTF